VYAAYSLNQKIMIGCQMAVSNCRIDSIYRWTGRSGEDFNSNILAYTI